mgnify:CR=1 FL=1
MSLTILKGTVVSAPAPGRLEATENGYLVAEGGVIRGVFPVLPEQYAGAAVEDCGDDLIVQSTEYCMSKVEDDFMQLSPTSPQDIRRFIDEVPYWTAKRHGKKYRLMYQVYTHPKYIEHGKRFFAGVTERYSAYARQMEPHLGIPCEVLTPLIFIFVRAAVHYALFEDEYYLKSQMDVLKLSVSLLIKQYQKEGQP